MHGRYLWLVLLAEVAHADEATRDAVSAAAGWMRDHAPAPATPAVGVCITGQLARLEISVKAANVLRPLAEAADQPLDVVFALDGDTRAGTRGVDRYPSPSAVDPTAALFSSEDVIVRALEPYRGTGLIRAIIVGHVERTLASKAAASLNGTDNSAASQLAPTVRPYAQRLGPKISISRVARAAIHLRQYEIMSKCDELLRKAAAQHGQQQRHQLLLRLRDDVISPLPVPAREIVQMLHNATRHGVGAIITSVFAANGGINDKGAFFNDLGRDAYLAAPLEVLGGALPREPAAFERFATRRVNGRELNPETLLWNIYAQRGLSMLTVRMLLAPLRLRRRRNGTCLVACAKVCARVYTYCPRQAGSGNKTEPVALVEHGRRRARRALRLGHAKERGAHELLASLQACHDRDAPRRKSVCLTAQQPGAAALPGWRRSHRSTPYWQRGWLLRGAPAPPSPARHQSEQPTIAISMADLERPPTGTVRSDEELWSLSDELTSPTRNHDCLVMDAASREQKLGAMRDDGELVVNFLGRWSRAVSRWNMRTGEQAVTTTHGVDPAGFELSDLNHVYAVPVDALDGASHKQEVWLPCGFHGDRVNQENSSSYARIIEVGTWKVRVGPKLPQSGGACAALALHLDGPDQPAHICTFGGTDGKHDSGKFMDLVSCYDRRRQRWHWPFPHLPIPMDHPNAVVQPAGRCSADEPARILIMNFRTRPYGGQHPEVLALDLVPRPALTRSGRSGSPTVVMGGTNGWYVFSNRSGGGTTQHGRDAAGVATAEDGRHVVNFGGVWYDYPRGHEMDVRFRRPNPFSEVRSLDTCSPAQGWTRKGTLGFALFALQSCASHRLNLAFTCGGVGEVMFKNKTLYDKTNGNFPRCIVNRLPRMQMDTRGFGDQLQVRLLGPRVRLGGRWM